MRMILDIICVIMCFYRTSFWCDPKMINITDFVQGDQVRLVDFGQTDVFYRRRLLSFGLTRGVDVPVVRLAPLGCPIQIDVRGTSLALRKEEAIHLRWERV